MMSLVNFLDVINGAHEPCGVDLERVVVVSKVFQWEKCDHVL